jgi:hypothetical protein
MWCRRLNQWGESSPRHGVVYISVLCQSVNRWKFSISPTQVTTPRFGIKPSKSLTSGLSGNIIPFVP